MNSSTLRSHQLPSNPLTYVYDNEDILLELDGSNNITARYTHGPGIDEPLIMEKGGASFFYHADGLGSITEITDASGVVKQRYTYSSFGKIESQLDPNFVQPYTFTAREFDPETDTYHYRQRQYDWRTGRFNQEDSIRFLDSFNFYPYLGNNPIDRIDPMGLWYIDIGYSGTAGVSIAGATVGVQIGPSGIYGYYGFGLGLGAGISATVNTGDPSAGVSVTASARGGRIVGGQASYSYGQEGGSFSAGIGLGLGAGASITATQTVELFSFRRQAVKSLSICQ